MQDGIYPMYEDRIRQSAFSYQPVTGKVFPLNSLSFFPRLIVSRVQTVFPPFAKERCEQQE